MYVDELYYDERLNRGETDISSWFRVVTNVLTALPNVEKISFTRQSAATRDFFSDSRFLPFVSHIGTFIRIGNVVRSLSINENIRTETHAQLEELMYRAFTTSAGPSSITSLKFAPRAGTNLRSPLYMNSFGKSGVDLESLVSLKFSKKTLFDDMVYWHVLQKTSPDKLKSLQITMHTTDSNLEFREWLQGAGLQHLKINLSENAFITTDDADISVAGQIVQACNKKMLSVEVTVLGEAGSVPQEAIDALYSEMNDHQHIVLFSITTAGGVLLSPDSNTVEYVHKLNNSIVDISNSWFASYRQKRSTSESGRPSTKAKRHTPSTSFTSTSSPSSSSSSSQQLPIYDSATEEDENSELLQARIAKIKEATAHRRQSKQKK